MILSLSFVLMVSIVVIYVIRLGVVVLSYIDDNRGVLWHMKMLPGLMVNVLGRVAVVFVAGVAYMATMRLVGVGATPFVSMLVPLFILAVYVLWVVDWLAGRSRRKPFTFA